MNDSSEPTFDSSTDEREAPDKLTVKKGDLEKQIIPKKGSKIWDFTVKFLSWFGCYYNRLEVTGMEYIPEHGPALLCINHPGLLDPAYVHIPILRQKKRWMHWLGWAGLETTQNRFVQWIVKNVGSITFVDEHEGKAKSSQASLKAMEQLSQKLQQGHLVGIFPEGLNHKFWDYKKPYRFRTGAIRLALRNKVPIIPTAITGTHRVWMTFGEIKLPRFHIWLTIPIWFPAKVKVAFGEPFYLDEKLLENPDDYDLILAETERLKKVIYDLLETIL